MTAPALRLDEIRAKALQRLARLPAHQRAAIVLSMEKARAKMEATGRAGARAHATRDYIQRRRYAGDPWAYFADILGWTLTPQQETALELMERHTRLLIPAANNAGKTFLIGGYGLYLFDAVAALEDPDTGEAEQGARILLPGPDHPTIFATIYSEMLAHAYRAELRGHLMPGERSEKSVLWRVRPKWEIEPFSPPDRVDQEVAHTASGRHHRNQHALIEEGQGVSEQTWKGAEGMCSSDGNKIISPFNPTEPKGPAFTRARKGAYRVIHLSAFDHPNVKERRPVIPAAIDVLVVDARVRTDCRDRGAYPDVLPDPAHGDFVYGLPETGDRNQDAPPERGAPRTDGHLGAAGAPLRVYRPNGAFTAQVMGDWPKDSESGLFGTADLTRAEARGRAPIPNTIPDRVGFDPTREGDDEPVAAPAWGPAGDVLLREFFDAQKRGAGAMAQLQATRRLRIGEVAVLARGKGDAMAEALVQRFPNSPFTADAGGVGSSPVDFLQSVHRRQVLEVAFSEAPRDPVPDEPFTENLRTQLYVRLAMLTARDLVDLPDDPLLREELLAHELVPTTRVVEVWDVDPKTRVKRKVKKRMPAVRLIDKDEVKKRIGRSPDRADAAVLAAFDEPRRPARRVAMLASESQFTI